MSTSKSKRGEELRLEDGTGQSGFILYWLWFYTNFQIIIETIYDKQLE